QANNKGVRRFASTDKPQPVKEEELDIPTYWIRPTPILSAEAGAHRFVWDLHYPPPEGSRQGTRRSYPISAIYRDTPSEPRGPWAMPGEYQVKLAINSQSYTQPLTIKMDPRVKMSAEELQKQFGLSMQCYEGLHQGQTALEQIKKYRAQLKELGKKGDATPEPSGLGDE